MEKGKQGGGLAERVGSLEAELEAQGRELRFAIRRLDRLTAASRAKPEDVPACEVPPERSGDEAALFGGADGSRGVGMPPGLERLRSGEWWLNKVGIGLLLFGAAFLFKFSVDQNWITPGVRVGLGLGLGTLLVVLGLGVYADRRAFSQVLLGGGIGVFYITGYAAFQLYALVPYAAAFAFMVAVTSLALLLSLRQNGSALALIGTGGGLGTPFILYAGAGSVGGLVLYTSLILAGACAIYTCKGWSSVLLAAFVGSWTVYLLGFPRPLYPPDWTYSQHQPMMQLGVTFAWLLLGLAAVWREVLEKSGPRRWPRPEPGTLARTFFAEAAMRSSAPARVVSTAAPLVALWFTQQIWDLEEPALGWVSLAAALIYAVAAILARRVENAGWVRHTQALTALSLATLALVLLLDGNALLATLAFEAAVLHHLLRRTSGRLLSVGAHALSAWVGGWISIRLIDGVVPVLGPVAGRVPVLNAASLTELVAISLVLAASLAMVRERVIVAYRMAAHAALLALLWQELSPLPDGAAYTTIAWGLYAAGLLVAGLRLDRPSLIRTGMATLFLVVGKLFLVDLAGVEAVWRILLFLGFGGLFLVLSYYLPHLWKPRTGGAGEVARGDGWLSGGRRA